VVPGRLLRSPVGRDTTSLPAPRSPVRTLRCPSLIHPARPPRPGAGFGASTDGPGAPHLRHDTLRQRRWVRAVACTGRSVCHPPVLRPSLRSSAVLRPTGHPVRTAPRATRHPCAVTAQFGRSHLRKVGPRPGGNESLAPVVGSTGAVAEHAQHGTPEPSGATGGGRPARICLEATGERATEPPRPADTTRRSLDVRRHRWQPPAGFAPPGAGRTHDDILTHDPGPDNEPPGRPRDRSSARGRYETTSATVPI